MSVLEFIAILIVAGVCGATGQAISGYSRGGCLASIGIGFIGALIGLWLARLMSLPTIFTIDIGGTDFPVVWSIFGGAIFVALLGFIQKGRR